MISTPVNESELIRQTCDGDMHAFETLYRMHAGHIYGLCLRMTGSPSQADDCVQETLIRAWQNIRKFRGDSAFRTWLHRIAVNEVLDRQSSDQRRDRKLTLVHDAMRADVDSTHPDIDLERAIGELPDGARNAFILQKIHGYSHEEAARMLGIAAGTCKAQVHRARQLLIERLKL